MLQKVETHPRDLQPYGDLVREEAPMDLERLGARMKDLKVAHVITTSRGGVRQGFCVASFRSIPPD